MKKNRLHLWMTGCAAVLLSSCLGENEGLDENKLSNCQVSSFSLQNDSIPGLSSVKFTIDQVNGLIYNKDSMPYGTVIDRKAVCTMNYELAPSAVEVYQEALKDSTFGWNGTDSLDFSDFVRFIVYSYNGKASKRYTARLNVHRVNPDSMVWALSSAHPPGKNVQEQKVLVWNGACLAYTKDEDGYKLHVSPQAGVPEWTETALDGLADKTFYLWQITAYAGELYLPASDGSLYRSADGVRWEIQSDTPAVKALLGTLEATEQPQRLETLAAIVQEGDTWYFATLADAVWKTGVPVPERFPVTGFAGESYIQMYYPHLVTVAGKDRSGRLSDASWGTMDGLEWVCLTDIETSYFEPREGAMLVEYDSRLFLSGGIDASGKALKDIYWSMDKGVSWTPADSLIALPEDFRGRGYASTLVDGEQFLLLFGGKESSGANMLEEMWRGRINRLGFKE